MIFFLGVLDLAQEQKKDTVIDTFLSLSNQLKNLNSLDLTLT